MAEENEEGFLDAFAILRAFRINDRDQTAALDLIHDLLKGYEDPADLVFGVAGIAGYAVNQFAKGAGVSDAEILDQLYGRLTDALAEPDA